MKKMMLASVLVSALACALCGDSASADHALDAADGSPTNVVYVDNQGRVGIGTTVPAFPLDVAGLLNLNKGKTGIALRVDGAEALWYDGTRFSWGYGGTANYFADRVGIGVAVPEQKLHVSGLARFDLPSGQIHVSTPGGWPGLIAFSSNGHRRDITFWDGGMRIEVSPSASPSVAGSGISIMENGNVGIGKAPAAKLDVAGTLRVSNAAGAPVVELGEGLDYAEGFDVSDRDGAGPGTVLVIDTDHPGKLTISSKAYDRKVAGIAAGAKGLSSAVRLGVGQFDCDVALAGRVYCNVDATDAGVEPGDLLTTSVRPGYAMGVSDYTKAQGAILGKAMEKLEKGKKGQVLVLVTLQ